MTPENEKALRDAYERAAQALADASKSKNRTAVHEQAYGNAYQSLVRAGLAPQLSRPRYRGYHYAPGNSLG